MPNPNAPILCMNGGSSSIKFAVFDHHAGLHQLLAGSLQGIGGPGATLRVRDAQRSEETKRSIEAPDAARAVAALMADLGERIIGLQPIGIGHRIVHGGPDHWQPQRITAELITALKNLSAFDPEHLPGELLLIEALQARFPGLDQIACFDTAFHRDLPRVAQLLPIPGKFAALGIRRFGFHGLSYAFLLQELERLAGASAARGRVILAHLGSGASMCALHLAQSLDTTMGFTPASGLVMSTRSGDLDPGLGAFLAERVGMTPDEFARMANHESGLLGVSETSPDMERLLQHEAVDGRAADAVALFCYQAKKSVGAYAAALGGLDTLVFSGGIGEKSARVRSRICAGLEFLGIELDAARNDGDSDVISTDQSRVQVRVIRTDEEFMIAQAVVKVLESK